MTDAGVSDCGEVDADGAILAGPLIPAQDRPPEKPQVRGTTSTPDQRECQIRARPSERATATDGTAH